MRSNSVFAITAAFVVAVLSLAGCGKDTGSGNNASACTADTDCALGKVCSFENECISAGCENCTPDQICYTPTMTCSAPECTSDDQCADGNCRNGQCGGGCVTNEDCNDGEVCNLAGECAEGDGTCAADQDCPSGQVCKDNACVSGCSTHDDCADGQFCNAQSQCAAGCRADDECSSSTHRCVNGVCGCTVDSCGAGKVCLDSGNCGDPTSCAQIDCGAQVCNPATLTCVDRCTDGSCQPNEACNMASGLCEINNCPAEDPAQCNGTSRPIWDPIKCVCVECLDNNGCTAPETCNAAGTCFACQTMCDPNTPGICQGATPYCINDCCVQCVGAADCAAGEFCIDGTCGPPPNCMADPSVCPAGYTCTNGQCQAPTTGTACDPMNPNSCPQGTFCDPTTSMCGGLGGAGFCGLCNPDCTCDGGGTCDGFFCTCDVLQQNCPSGQTCIPGSLLGLADFCLPL